MKELELAGAEEEVDEEGGFEEGREADGTFSHPAMTMANAKIPNSCFFLIFSPPFFVVFHYIR